MSTRRLSVAAIVCFLIGVGLVFPFTSTLTRIVGIAAFFAFIVCGVFAIANPDDLARGPD